MLIEDLMPGECRLIRRDDGSGAEVRMELFLRIKKGGREAKLNFEFPKLYIQRNLKNVDQLGKPGWTATAEGEFRNLPAIE